MVHSQRRTINCFGYRRNTIVDDNNLVKFVRSYALMKRIFHFSHVMVTTVKRERVKFMFSCNVHEFKIISGVSELLIFNENGRKKV